MLTVAASGPSLLAAAREFAAALTAYREEA